MQLTKRNWGEWERWGRVDEWEADRDVQKDEYILKSMKLRIAREGKE